jgi:hypothetical protein
MNIHFPERAGLVRPGVLVFPNLLICLDCGSTEFAIPAAKLAALVRGTGTSEAAGQREGAEGVTVVKV